VVDGGCTTEGTKTHKTGCRRVVYAWHPLHGRDLNVIGTMNRHGEVMLVCQVEASRAPLEVPAWMFDLAMCCHCRSASTPRVGIESLTSLTLLLETTRIRDASVIEAQHQSTFSGGSDAKGSKGGTISAPAVSAVVNRLATGGECQSEADSSCGQAAAECRRASRKSTAQPGRRS
jgi:hypothetical protein